MAHPGLLPELIYLQGVALEAVGRQMIDPLIDAMSFTYDEWSPLLRSIGDQPDGSIGRRR
jgi:hypothetical protein